MKLSKKILPLWGLILWLCAIPVFAKETPPSAYQFPVGGLSLSGDGEFHESDWTFESNGTGYTITNYSGSDDVVEIPSVYNGKPVTAIGEYAFQSNWAEEIHIPGSITSIGKGAFSYCYYLTKIQIPSSVTFLDDAAFFSCSNLKQAEILGPVTTLSQGLFADCQSLSSVTLPSGITTVEDYAFQNTALTSFTIPKSCSSFSNLAFFSTNSLQTLTVASGNSHYKVVNGILYNGAGTTLLLYTSCHPGTACQVPEGVTDIAEYAFSYSSITSVTLPSSLKTIGDWAFAASKLQTLTVPSNVANLGDGIVDECTSLKSLSVLSSAKTLPYRTAFLCTALEKVVLNDAITEIGNQAFYGCTALKEINWPSKLETVGVGAFYNCDTTKIVLPGDLTDLGDGSYRKLPMVRIKAETCYGKAYEVLTLVNQERKKEGLSSLTMDKELLDAAMQRAAETVLLFSHTRPSGISCFSACDKMHAENIAYGASTASYVMTLWMNSSGHRANILRDTSKSVGIGCVYYNGCYYWVQCFGSENATTLSMPSDSSKTYSIYTTKELLSLAYTQGSKLSLKAGQTKTLEIESDGIRFTSDTFTWTSSNPSVASVTSKGTVTANSGGTATITAALKNDASIKITIKITVTGSPVVTLNRTKVGLSKGSTYTLKVTSSAKNITWKSSNSKVVTVKNGKLTAKNTGTATIKATSGSLTATCKVTVISLKKPVIKTISSKKKGQVTLKWGKVTGATRYVVYRSTKKSSGYKKIATVKTTTYTDKKASSKKKYYYKIKAYKTVSGMQCYSSASSAKSVKVK